MVVVPGPWRKYSPETARVRGPVRSNPRRPGRRRQRRLYASIGIGGPETPAVAGAGAAGGPPGERNLGERARSVRWRRVVQNPVQTMAAVVVRNTVNLANSPGDARIGGRSRPFESPLEYRTTAFRHRTSGRRAHRSRGARPFKWVVLMENEVLISQRV